MRVGYNIQSLKLPKLSCIKTQSTISTYIMDEKQPERIWSMEHDIWVNKLLDQVCDLGDEGISAVEFIRARGTKIGFKKARPNVGAFWTVFGNIRLNSQYYAYETPFDNLRIKTLIVHEARHLQ